MITITIDTNIVRDYLEPSRGRHPVAIELMALDAAKACEVRIVSRIKADVPGGPLREKLNALEVCMRPTIPTIAQWDLSTWDDDFWVTDEQGREFDALLDLIFPGSDRNSPRHPNRVKDVGHLLGHKLAGRDVFVSNERAFLGRAQQLLKQHSIQVMSSARVVEFVKEHGELTNPAT